MTEQNPRVSSEGEDDQTVFQPAPKVRSDESTVIAGLSGANAFDDRTIVRPGPSLRRPGVPASPRRAEATSAPPPPRQSAVQSLGLEAPNENPLLQAAAPLLLLLGRLRTSLLRATDSSLVPQIATAIETCERELAAAEVDPEEARIAKFVLCVTADEVLANMPRGEQDVAQRSGLLTRFFGESDGSRKFLDALDEARENPKARYDLLELFHACLVLCFQGGNATLLGGSATLQDLRQDLHERLQQARPTRSLPLSLRWEGQPVPSHATRVRVPLWAVAGFVGLVLVLAFVGFRLSVGAHADAAATTLLDLVPPRPVQIRKDPVPPPAPPQPTAAQASQVEHIRKVLGPSIAAGDLDVHATPNQVVVQVADKALFQPGKASVVEDGRPLVMLLALALDDEKGPIKVVGHLDDTPVASTRFASSFELSLERARNVASILKKNLTDPDRVTAEGKGGDAPIAANDTREGRARNRRVEIVIPRSE